MDPTLTPTRTERTEVRNLNRHTSYLIRTAWASFAEPARFTGDTRDGQMTAVASSIKVRRVGDHEVEAWVFGSRVLDDGSVVTERTTTLSLDPVPAWAVTLLANEVPA
ncbi:hypothetical protein SEA_BIGGITYBASS_58 [Gordonia phage BiggityBass]|nr:hypothetical protein SEA_BIGGITYBASS_58 [Gordonia phage BiggityBass]